MASTASAQSVLERVLGQIDNSTNLASVNGTFANIAENIGGVASVTTYTASLSDAQATALGLDVGTASASDNYTLSQAQIDSLTLKNEYTTVADEQAYNPETGAVITLAAYNALDASSKAAYILNDAETPVNVYYAPGSATATTATDYANIVALTAWTATETLSGFGVEGIDGSITNIVDGITDSTQTAVAGSVSAVEYNMPTLNFGDMATTALGAVNTGDITLGVNSSVDNAKTTSTEAVSSVMAQLGGSADTGAIVLNIASNMTGVNGSISNTMTEVNGTVGGLSTTALGAVNTGTIISGVNAAVTGITGASSGQSGL